MSLEEPPMLDFEDCDSARIRRPMAAQLPQIVKDRLVRDVKGALKPAPQGMKAELRPRTPPLTGLRRLQDHGVQRNRDTGLGPLW
jgi:hypothetical protein